VSERYWRTAALEALFECAWWRQTFDAEELERHATRSRLIREFELSNRPARTSQSAICLVVNRRIRFALDAEGA
jgi:hypothetical protein